MSYRIEDIDKNFARAEIGGREIVFCDVRCDPFDIYGLYEAKSGDGAFRRLPPLEGVCGGVNHLATNTAGGRVRFKTNSPYIAIKVEIEDACHMAHMTLCGSCGLDLYRFDGKEEKYIKTFIPSGGICYGEKSFQCFAQLKEDFEEELFLTLNLPLYNGIKKLEIGLAPDAKVDHGAPYRLDKPIVYYGSSITQGGCASRPGNAYPALISHVTNMDHVNLGFSGSCIAEKAMAEYISDLPMCAFVYDYDYNAGTPEYLLETHEPFFVRIREKNPDLPVIIISAPCVATENGDNRRRDIIRTTYENALRRGDKNVYFIDGGHLYDGPFADSCTVDGVHPNDLGFSRMAQGILPVLKKALDL